MCCSLWDEVVTSVFHRINAAFLALQDTALTLRFCFPPKTARYALLLDTYIKDRQERDNLFNAYNSIPCVKQKGEPILFLCFCLFIVSFLLPFLCLVLVSSFALLSLGVMVDLIVSFCHDCMFWLVSCFFSLLIFVDFVVYWSYLFIFLFVCFS